jgi:hypothetical protein
VPTTLQFSPIISIFSSITVTISSIKKHISSQNQQKCNQCLLHMLKSAGGAEMFEADTTWCSDCAALRKKGQGGAGAGSAALGGLHGC